MTRFVRTDKRTFERAFFAGGKVIVDKNGPSNRPEFRDRFSSDAHTIFDTPNLLDMIKSDPPSRSGEAFNYYVAIEVA